MIVGKLMQSVLGIRMVLGALAAAVIGLGVTTWGWMDAEGNAAQAQAEAREAAFAAENNAARARELKRERDRLDEAVTKLRRRREKREAELQAELSEVRDALQDDDCARAELPADARRRVFPDADGDKDGDGSGDSAGDADEADQ